MNTVSLFHIRQEHLDLMAQIEEAEGELAPHVEQALGLTEEAFQEKAISYGYVIKQYETNADLIEREIMRLQNLQKQQAARGELFKQRLADAMQQFGVEKIDGNTLKLSFRKSQAVVVTDESLLPDDAFKMVPAKKEISKTQIKEMFKAGPVPGAMLETRQSLQVK